MIKMKKVINSYNQHFKIDNNFYKIINKNYKWTKIIKILSIKINNYQIKN